MHSSPAAIVDTVHDVVDTLAPVRDLECSVLRQEILDCDRAAQILLARQSALLAEMGRRAAAEDRAEEEQRGRPLGAHGRRAEFVADEVAVTLSITKMAAGHRYDTALRASRHPTVMAAWSQGLLDQRKVEVIVTSLEDVDQAVAASVADAAVQYAQRRTAPQLRQWLARRVIAADPGAAEIRRARATAERRVLLTPLSDGVAELSALLPSIQARQIYDTVNALAHAASAEDVRTMDQRRADALFDLLTGRAEPPQVRIQVVVPAETLLGEGVEPGFVPGIGAVTASEACELAGIGAVQKHHEDVTWRRLLADEMTGALLDVAERQYRPSRGLERAVRARDVTCRFPGCRRTVLSPGGGTDLDHTVPWPAGPTSAANLVSLCRHHHRVKHSPGWSTVLRPDGTLEWTTPGGRRVVTEPWHYGVRRDELVGCGGEGDPPLP